MNEFFIMIMATLAAIVLGWLITPLMRGGYQRTGLAVAGVLASAALGFYLWQGQPQMPDSPLQPRLAARAEVLVQIQNGVSKLEQQLAANPADRQGWLLLGQSYLALGDKAKADTAFKRAEQLAVE